MIRTLGTASAMTVLFLAICLASAKALVPDGLGLDRALAAAFFGAKKGETISLIVAQWNAAGRRSGCRWCWFLNWAVERNHCALQLDPASPATPVLSGLRAGFCLLMLSIVLWFVPLLVWRGMSVALGTVTQSL